MPRKRAQLRMAAAFALALLVLAWDWAARPFRVTRYRAAMVRCAQCRQPVERAQECRSCGQLDQW
jgi:hypothetical protein